MKPNPCPRSLGPPGQAPAGAKDTGPRAGASPDPGTPPDAGKPPGPGTAGPGPQANQSSGQPPSGGRPESQARQESRARKRRQALWDIAAFLIKLAVTALVGWVLLGVVFGVAVMEGESMYPRLRDGDLMVLYRMEDQYTIDDVVTFVSDGTRYTGRIVAQGGDTVELSENGEVLVNGNVQNEEIFYVTLPSEGGITYPCQVPQGSVFLLCDFRTNGTDSRSYGPVSVDQLDGKVIAILRRRGI